MTALGRYIPDPQVILDEGGELALTFGALPINGQRRAIARAERRVDSITGQDGGLQLQTNKVAVVYPVTDGLGVNLPNRPIQSITSVSVLPPRANISMTYPVDPISLRTTGGQRLEYHGMSPVLYPAALFDRPFPFMDGDQVTVTYTCGYAVIPEDVIEATILCLQLDLMLRRDNPAGATSTGADGASQSFSGTNPILAMIYGHLRNYMCGVS